MISREELIEKVKGTAAVPAISMQALRLLNDPNASVDEATKCFQYDPGMTANIIKLANSSMFPARVQVTTLRDAIIRIGFKQSLEMLVGMAFSSRLSKPVSGYDLDSGGLLNSAVSGAVYAQVIARVLKLPHSDLMFTGCMLRDIGKILLGSIMEVDVEKIIAEVQEHEIAFEEAERKILGVDHSEVGAILMESWNMPDEFIAIVRYHHRPGEYDGPEEIARIVKIAHIADILSAMTGDNYGVDGLSYRLDKNVAEEFGLDEELVEKIIFEQEMEFEELKASGIV